VENSTSPDELTLSQLLVALPELALYRFLILHLWVQMTTYRLKRLFNAKSNRCFDVAVDHGLFNEPTFHDGATASEAKTMLSR